MSRKLFVVFLGLVLGAVALLLPGVLVVSNGQAGLCGLSSADAQDNPCLPQEATISALLVENISLQATMTSMQATMSAMQSGGVINGQEPGQTAAVSVPGLPFYDDFSNNNNGWQLTSGASITQGELVVTGNHERDNFVTLPGIHANNFYLEIDVWGEEEGRKWAVAFGDFSGQEGTEYYQVGYAYDQYDYSYLYLKSSTEQGNNIWQSDFYPEQTPTKMGFYLHNGQLEIYAEGELFAIVQVTPQGEQVALGIAQRYRHSTIAHFDNLEVRAAR